MNYIFLALLSSVFWGLSPFLDKFILKKLTFFTAYLLKSIVIFLTSIFAMFYFKDKLDDYRAFILIKDQYFNNLPLLILLSGIFASLGTFFYFFSMKNSKNSYLVLSITYALPIIFFSLLVRIFISEKIKLKSLIGILLVSLGLILIK